MLDNELPKGGLPPRDRNADVPEHASNANRRAVCMGGIVAICVVIALIMFGDGSGYNNTASNSLNTEPGTTTGAAPAASPQKAR
jgi:hypothetical protein